MGKTRCQAIKIIPSKIGKSKLIRLSRWRKFAGFYGARRVSCTTNYHVAGCRSRLRSAGGIGGGWKIFKATSRGRPDGRRWRNEQSPFFCPANDLWRLRLPSLEEPRQGRLPLYWLQFVPRSSAVRELARGCAGHIRWP